MKKLSVLAASIMLFAFSTFAIAADVFFEIKATKPAFTPSSITVNKGDHVTLKIIAEDHAHGIHIDEFGLEDVIIPENESRTLEFTADKAGTFSFPCTKYCGYRHLIGRRPRLEIKVVE
ncbi:MAG: hypothetical protein A3J24_10610 [Deltaproteobacteria bacterium RIFCSPLOWO2_02_FULL_53_8]|nr:MAG: hypothetical protein A3J24_10610 [Deltaproteobacteria bacterium RIFCSPLOWO2_02_FULL_53_8]